MRLVVAAAATAALALRGKGGGGGGGASASETPCLGLGAEEGMWGPMGQLGHVQLDATDMASLHHRRIHALQQVPYLCVCMLVSSPIPLCVYVCVCVCARHRDAG